ncbi:MAG: hypothetical protein F6K17_07675 [Okeania sp. SIO3C4]|nr:hypothetical protein [Okeania sp. SIO3B3]NER02512.1 hypothetical protein [Okeania sp. SIO3C4]
MVIRSFHFQGAILLTQRSAIANPALWAAVLFLRRANPNPIKVGDRQPNCYLCLFPDLTKKLSYFFTDNSMDLLNQNDYQI